MFQQRVFGDFCGSLSSWWEKASPPSASCSWTCIWWWREAKSVAKAWGIWCSTIPKTVATRVALGFKNMNSPAATALPSSTWPRENITTFPHICFTFHAFIHINLKKRKSLTLLFFPSWMTAMNTSARIALIITSCLLFRGWALCCLRCVEGSRTRSVKIMTLRLTGMLRNSLLNSMSNWSSRTGCLCCNTRRCLTEAQVNYFLHDNLQYKEYRSFV